MTKKTKIKKLITHNGSFHSDDVFACATLILYLEKKNKEFSAQGATPAKSGGQGPASGWKIIRTRDEKIIKNGDYVFDVGGVYNAKLNRFDHHQKGGAGRRPNGIPYSSFGLVWKKFGIKICEDKKAVNLIDKKLIAPIDAGDNGFDLIGNKYEVFPYLIQDAFSSMRPTWREENINNDKIFLKSVKIAKEILWREIVQTKDIILAEKKVISIYQNTADKRIIVLNRNYPYKNTLNNFPEPLFVVYPRMSDNLWGVKTMRDDPKTFKNRKDLPKSWAGFSDGTLAKVTGVFDAVFCHRGLFLAIAKSKEGAIKLAKLALLK